MKKVKNFRIFVSLLLVMCTFVGTMHFSGIDADAAGSENQESSYWEWNKVTCWDDMQKLGVETNASNMAILVITGKNVKENYCSYDDLAENKDLEYCTDARKTLTESSEYYDGIMNKKTKFYSDKCDNTYSFDYKGKKKFALKYNYRYRTTVESMYGTNTMVDGSYLWSFSEDYLGETYTFEFARDYPDNNVYKGLKDCCKIYSHYSYYDPNISIDPYKGFLFTVENNGAILRKGEFDGKTESSVNSNFWIFVGTKKSGIRPDKKGSSMSSEGSGYECWKWTKLTSLKQCGELGLKDANLTLGNESTYRSKLKSEFKTSSDLRIMMVFNKGNSDCRKSIEEYTTSELVYMSNYINDKAGTEYCQYCLQTYALDTVYDYAQFATGNDVIYTTTAANLPIVRMFTDNTNIHNFGKWKGINFALWSDHTQKWINAAKWEFNFKSGYAGYNFCFYEDNKSDYGKYYIREDSCIVHWDSGAYVSSWSTGASPRFYEDTRLLTENINCWVWIGVKSTNNGTTYDEGKTLSIDDDTVYSVNGVMNVPKNTTINIEAGSTLDINGTLHLGGIINNYGTIVLNKGAKLIMSYNGYDGIINNFGGDLITCETSILDMQHYQLGGSGGYIDFRNSTFSVNGDVYIDFQYTLLYTAYYSVFLKFSGGNTVNFTSTANLYIRSGFEQLTQVSSGTNGDSVSNYNFPTPKKFSSRTQPRYN